jgi:hypothetical protein
MTIFGWLFLTLFWGGLLLIVIFCLEKVLFYSDKSK